MEDDGVNMVSDVIYDVFVRSYIKYYADSNSITARESSQPIEI